LGNLQSIGGLEFGVHDANNRGIYHPDA
jgi:hypothetical protein